MCFSTHAFCILFFILSLEPGVLTTRYGLVQDKSLISTPEHKHTVNERGKVESFSSSSSSEEYGEAYPGAPSMLEYRHLFSENYRIMNTIKRLIAKAKPTGSMVKKNKKYMLPLGSMMHHVNQEMRQIMYTMMDIVARVKQHPETIKYDMDEMNQQNIQPRNGAHHHNHQDYHQHDHQHHNQFDNNNGQTYGPSDAIHSHVHHPYVAHSQNEKFNPVLSHTYQHISNSHHHRHGINGLTHRHMTHHHKARTQEGKMGRNGNNRAANHQHYHSNHSHRALN